MKKIAISTVMFLSSALMWAQENPLWMRYCAISPDGNTIAFSYKGDIFTVPSEGGKATQITTHASYDSKPLWSPDGKLIAFASDRMGSLDVYIVAREGGVPTRLTTHSGSETPIAFKDNQSNYATKYKQYYRAPYPYFDKFLNSLFHFPIRILGNSMQYLAIVLHFDLSISFGKTNIV